MRVFITGATGFVGRAVIAALRARGDRVTALTRSAARAQDLDADVVEGDLESPLRWPAALVDHDAVVNLAGEPLAAKRWDARQKQIVRDSRVEGTRVLVEVLNAMPRPPATLVSASGIDYYPFSYPPMDDDEVTEADPASDSFLGRLCRDWEREALAASGRVVCLRTGVVLGHGGALTRLVPVFNKLAGGSIGNGRQFFSWIHLDDHVRVVLAALDDARVVGPINAVAGSVRYREFATALGHALGKPSILRTPGFALKLVLGEFADYLVNGRNVVPAALQAIGFRFTYATLAEALKHI